MRRVFFAAAEESVDAAWLAVPLPLAPSLWGEGDSGDGVAPAESAGIVVSTGCQLEVFEKVSVDRDGRGRETD